MYTMMLDTANLNEIKAGLAAWPISGVTSNPSILKKEGKVDIFAHLEAIKSHFDGTQSLHVQVVSEDTAGIIAEAHAILDRLGHDTFIKIPASAAGLPAIKVLAAEGVKITATAIYSTMQGILAVLAGARYLAIFYNRMENNCTEPEQVIEELRAFIDGADSDAMIIAASFRSVAQVTRAYAAGAHCATVAPDILRAALAMPAVDGAIKTFTQDFASVWGEGNTLLTQ